MGGLIGCAESCIVSNCYCKGTISGRDNIGGLIGGTKTNFINSNVTNCYTTGSVNGNQYVGGLIGQNMEITINSCYSTGTVSGTNAIGGLVGANNGGYFTTIIACFWDIETSGQNGINGGRGLTTEQMKTMSIYQNAGWVDKGWVIDDGMDYPHLAWEGTNGTPIPAAIVPYIGSGTLENPYQIWTAQDFAFLSWYQSILDKHIVLMADIDLGGVEIYPIGDMGRFTGSFNGNGHVIRNAIINQPANWLGIFKYVDIGGEVINLGIEDVNIIGKDYVGGLTGYNIGTVSGCYLTGNVGGDWEVGGLIGINDWAGKTTNCYSNSSVYGDSYIGGLIGQNYDGTISSCYSTGLVSGTEYYVGGLIGVTYNDPNITACFWDVNSSRQTVGVSEGGGVYGKTTVQMKQKATFAASPYNWDFVNTWAICEGTNYPRLKWQKLNPGDYICPDGVNFLDFAILAMKWLHTDYGDANGLELTDDGIVNFGEFAIMASLWKVAGCGSCNGADYNNDGDIDEDDLKVLGQNWLRTDYGNVGGIELTGDGKIDYEELKIFAEEWLK